MIYIAPPKNIFSKLALFLAALIWGSSFIVVKDTVDIMAPNLLLALRFSSACIILTVFFIKKIKTISAKDLFAGAIIGFMLFLAYSTQTIGITDTTPGKNAFLTAIYCVMVPFLFWFFTKIRPDRYNLIAAFLCITGIGFISLTSTFSISFGDTLTLVGGFFFALHLVAITIFARDKDPIIITILQFFFAAVLSWITTLVFENKIPKIEPNCLPYVAYLSVFCTAGALLLQNIGQKNTNPSAAAIILSLESVFGAILSVALGYEVLTPKLFFGFTLIFLSVIISETKLSFLFKKNK